MAETKKKDQAAEAAAEELKEQASEQEELISIRLPLTKELQNDVFVRVNHRTWLIKRGETVKVPACVVEVLEHSEQATMDGIRYQASKERTDL